MIARVWNSAVFWAGLSTFLRLGGFVFVLPVALRKLSADEFGIWIAMQGLYSLVMLMEAGFSPCLGRFASYYYAGAKKVPSLGIDSEPVPKDTPPNYSALAGLVKMAQGFYGRFALGSLIFLTVGGTWWLGWKFHSVFLRWEVLPAYLCYAVGVAANMAGYFWGDLLSGTHQMRNAYRNTILGLVLNYVVSLIMLVLGCGLLSMAVGQLIAGTLPRLMARHQYLKLFPTKEYPNPQPTSALELLPMCWRTALTGLAAYLLARSMSLVAAQVIGLKAAGSLGLSMNLCFALSGVSQTWLVVKYPLLTMLRSKRDEKELRRVVHGRMALCLATYAVGMIFLLLAAPTFLELMKTRTQVLPTPLFAMLLGVLGMDLYMGLNTSIMISENRTRFMVPFVASGLATLVLSLVLGKWLGLMGIILAPFVVQLCWNYWWTPLACWQSLQLKTAGQIEAM